MIDAANLPQGLAAAQGYLFLPSDGKGRWAVRANDFERLALWALKKRKPEGFALDDSLRGLLPNTENSQLEILLRALGYQGKQQEGQIFWTLRGRKQRAPAKEKRPKRKSEAKHNPDSPFAVLADLKTARKAG